jgi:protein-S-isoprenylcysteine O-methyltransferase Ste14
VQLQVRCIEEPYLRAMHGAAYEHYAGAVGRFMPGVGRTHARVPGASGPG